MITDLHQLLEELKLRDARAAIDETLKLAQKNKPSYSTFLLDLLRREHEGQRNRATASRIKRSGLREFWALDTFPFHIQKCVNKRMIYELAELDFIARGESLVFIGQAAVGKLMRDVGRFAEQVDESLDQQGGMQAAGGGDAWAAAREFLAPDFGVGHGVRRTVLAQAGEMLGDLLFEIARGVA